MALLTNLGVAIVLFASTNLDHVVVPIGFFAFMTALSLALACSLVRHPALSAPIRRFGRVATPFVLIGIGVMVLVEVGTVSWITGAASRG
ncbi:cadmium resistance transporter [Methylobacterium sp. EM32]|uniref:cadmium resistance transporter n=1 Tax=Methylobacterium sp. EM32 TaxID=3163481 RepID=UPI0033A42EE6